MWGVFKKFVNSTIGTNKMQAIDTIVGKIANSSYDKRIRIPLNKKIKGELLLVPSTETYQELLDNPTKVNSSAQGNTTLGPYVVNRTGVYELVGELGDTTNPSQQTYYWALYVNEHPVSNTSSPFTISSGKREERVFCTRTFNKDDKIKITISKPASSGNHSISTLTLNAEEKQIPYITIVDKESE